MGINQHLIADAVSTQDSDIHGNKGILQCQRVAVVHAHHLSWTSLQSPLEHISSCLWCQHYSLVIHIPGLMEVQQRF